ncbi:serine/threonine-protein kinase [Bradyrhizobium sp. 191]|uniref:serine/threonine-protein kinase n=1 Tax=Bradyrhizobium sp. 191 TaxID=2782659 RepID=UPI001FFE459D|nr:serine/threonine-protein kinase [Bradyrhizobium sp. 191]UPJ62703.1 serine/threonine protein kinase [Bradyrhizobium sp. 191]
MTIISLKKDWILGERLGAGGFGQVFAAESPDGSKAAIKLVPKVPGASRELLFVDLKGARGVVPIIDSGEHGEHWILVMPRARKSLRDHLTTAKTPLSTADATPILIDIASALVELNGKVIHRDLKPENVLYLDGKWCLSDFGISRYAEATTAVDTQKFALSPPYAAPERWRAERATGAVDVYALGIMAFEMLVGRKPFPGPHIEDYREQHLHNEPPIIDVGTPVLKAIVTETLFKAPGARPSPPNLLARLTRSQQQRSGGLGKLSEAHLGEVAKQSESERQASAARSATEQRDDLFQGASALLDGLYGELSEAILEAAPSAKKGRAGKRNGVTISLGTAQLELVPLAKTPASPWGWEAPSFDVIAHAGIILRVPRDRYDFEGRSHSLWYCDALQAGRFEWIETAFMVSPLMGRNTTMRPFMADPGIEAAKALWAGMAEFQLAWPMEQVESEALIERWAGWLADAAQGRLHAPSTMPERPIPENWRRK